eukprot:4605575-Amphidinium_carterae.1
MAMGFMMRCLLAEFGSSAARGYAQRKGLGQQKHVHVRWLWVQDKVLAEEATVESVSMVHNVADALTKPVART